MTLPRMSARRWFWSLLAIGLLWAIAGNRWDADPGHPRWMRTLQGAPATVLHSLLTPPSWTERLVQSAFSGTLSRFTPQSAGNESPEELQERIKALENQDTQLKRALLKAYSTLEGFGNLEKLQIEPADVVEASITGGSGVGSRVLQLDKGTSHGVKVGDAILAPLQRVSLLGRVTSVGLLNCEAHLLTDPTPASSVRVQFVRPAVNPDPGSPNIYADTPLTREPSLLVGRGNYMEDDDLSIQLDIRPGDLVCLADNEWPRKVQNMVIGEVTSATPRAEQPLRYHLRVIPRVNIATQHTVMILIKN